MGDQCQVNQASARFPWLMVCVPVRIGETLMKWQGRRTSSNVEDRRARGDSRTVESACGVSGASTGPFYCPGDQKVYIDLSFFQELHTKFNAPGDFAIAYVVAHEIGHHVQYQLGITEEVFALKSRVSETEFNQYMVRLELQADYFAGVWAHYAQRAELLEPGDLEEAMAAASAVGDDRIQKQAYGYVVPDSFTHGTSEQRSRWFRKGFTEGTIEDGDTFNVASLKLLGLAA